jgi:aryl-alcohol dehydrogenase-like predicted oxidoreductase
LPVEPLAGGLLTGKYKHEAAGASGEGRIEKTKGSPFLKSLNERTWRIHDTLVDVAAQIDRTPAQVALS